MKQTSQRRFSLLESGILDKPAARTLIINVGATIHFTESESPYRILTSIGNARRRISDRGLSFSFAARVGKGSAVHTRHKTPR